MSQALNPDKALIFRIVHRNNVPVVMKNGCHCKSATVGKAFTQIGNLELISKRDLRVVPCGPGGTLSDYVPFYFTPYTPMLYNIKTGYGGVQKQPVADIVILVSSLHTLKQQGVPFVFSDRHAYLKTAQFSDDLKHLDRIIWPTLQARNFRQDDSGAVREVSSRSASAQARTADRAAWDSVLQRFGNRRGAGSGGRGESDREGPEATKLVSVMMIFTEGNLLEANADALVNTVNTVGVMGKGVALMFKEAFPENFKAYEKACKEKRVRLGEMFVTERDDLLRPKWIINFPTKAHWRYRSNIKWIEDGLADLARVIREKNIRSIAIPPLGERQRRPRMERRASAD